MATRLTRRLLATAALALGASLGFGGTAQAQNEIVIGSIATLEGPFATGGQDAYRAMELAFESVNYQIGGKKIRWIRESSNAQPDVALARARKLIEQDKVDFIIGPLSGAEGIALRDYSRTLQGKTIINGGSGAADTTLRDPSPNFFRFNTDGAQWMAGLGQHVFNDMKARHVTVVAGDYAFPYAQVFGFMHEFCRLGGRVTKLWSPLGTTDYASQIAQIPKDSGALLVVHGGSDGLAFMTQYAQSGGNLPLLGGSIMADQTMMSARGPHRRLLTGMISGGPVADLNDDANWRKFVEEYRKKPGAFQSPSIHALNFHTNTMAAILALQKVNGDLSDGQKKFQEALRTLVFKNAMGAEVRLDNNRHAIMDNFLTRVVERDGRLFTEAFARIPAVTQTLGMPQDQFMALGSPSRDNPNCPPGT
jgi:branched-chain amino acid transport system substrate-binding protein